MPNKNIEMKQTNKQNKQEHDLQKKKNFDEDKKAKKKTKVQT